jgi:hypothetical protein
MDVSSMNGDVDVINYETNNNIFKRIFDKLKNAKCEDCCIFGGSLRDSDKNVRENTNTHQNVKDYDIRIWTYDFDKTIHLLTKQFGKPKPVLGHFSCASKPRYIFHIWDVELDVSLRIKPNNCNLICAQERALDSDIGLSSIAMEPNGICCGRPEYVKDRDNKTLTIIKREYRDEKRIQNYTKRMQGKFPNHMIIE